ncbi:hypothetical protein OZX72_05505 [Bifidobacterium sp. ESL0769]|uniref:hypothetical protein n=1 Tax=Bifidobacterium sp. ESL0769 TaxID=2983229 RepID=UPI0023FA33B5|nr:hypothetical protein [Bifidobacterium sp. ESL0769]WEV66728.1 hypothetical protein OZX72_05505 [Bifidobacterium sp. ESL0769]
MDNNSTMNEEAKQLAKQKAVKRKPIIYNAICLVIIICATVFGGGGIAGLIVLLICGAVMNLINSGKANMALVPHNNVCLMAKAGTMRCLICEGVMLALGIVVIVIAFSVSGQ